MRYKVLTSQEFRAWVPPTIIAWYASKGYPEDKLRERVQWVFSPSDGDRLTIAFVTGGLEGEGGREKDDWWPHQDFWVMQADPDRSPRFGFPQQRWALYRGLPQTAGVHADEAFRKHEPTATIPILM